MIMYQISRMDCEIAEADAGTFLWIGDRDSRESNEVYRYCESVAPQIAYRADMDEAISRPASDVTHLLVHCDDTSIVSQSQRDRLAASYPNAVRVEMFGSIWEGGVHRGQSPCGTQPFYWHRWNQVLPRLLERDGAGETTAKRTANRSVLIIAATFSDADPLMDLASSADAVSVWCRSPQSMKARNFGVVWWDDSVARSVSQHQWRRRIASAERRSSIRPQHVWLAGAPRLQHYHEARNAGIDVVLSKPYRIDSLVSTLTSHRTDLSARSDSSNNRGLSSISTDRVAA